MPFWTFDECRKRLHGDGSDAHCTRLSSDRSERRQPVKLPAVPSETSTRAGFLLLRSHGRIGEISIRTGRCSSRNVSVPPTGKSEKHENVNLRGDSTNNAVYHRKDLTRLITEACSGPESHLPRGVGPWVVKFRSGARFLPRNS